MTSTCGMALRGLRLIWATDFHLNALTARCPSTLRATKRCYSVAFEMDAVFWLIHGFGMGRHGPGCTPGPARRHAAGRTWPTIDNATSLSFLAAAAATALIETTRGYLMVLTGPHNLP